MSAVVRLADRSSQSCLTEMERGCGEQLSLKAGAMRRGPAPVSFAGSDCHCLHPLLSPSRVCPDDVSLRPPRGSSRSANSHRRGEELSSPHPRSSCRRAQDVLADGACLHPGEVPTPDSPTPPHCERLTTPATGKRGRPPARRPQCQAGRGHARRQVPCAQPLLAGWAREPASRPHTACVLQGRASQRPPDARPSSPSPLISEPIKKKKLRMTERVVLALCLILIYLSPEPPELPKWVGFLSRHIH